MAVADKPSVGFTAEQVDLIKRTICKDASNDELALFLQQCARTGLDPFQRQIYAVKRWSAADNREVMSTQVSIDGFRLVAERTGEYEGQTAPQWCAADGVWREVWLAKESPAAARVGAWRKGFREPAYGVARFDAYAQRKRDGSLTAMWARMPDVMIAKCAESLALRKAFPQELSGLYTGDEMGQAENGHAPQGPLVIEAPKAVTPPPAGASRILRVVSTQWGAEVEVVDTDGVVAVYKTSERRCAELAEQLAQEGGPVTIDLATITRGQNAGKQKLVAVHRWEPPSSEQAQKADNAALDAEIAKQDTVPF
jgi:phage recombination protein Bet